MRCIGSLTDAPLLASQDHSRVIHDADRRRRREERADEIRSSIVFCFTDPVGFSPVDAEALADRMLAHPLVGRSQLQGTFEGSRGFGVALTSTGRTTLFERFPFLISPFGLFDAAPERLFRRRGAWPFASRPKANAYYMNVLVVDDGQGVGRHIDGTLGGPVSTPGLTPAVVSVLYLRVPTRESGGELSLFHDDTCVATVDPRPGMVAHFRGDLAHEIAPLLRATSSRVSLVCEQYVLSDEQSARLSPFAIQSRAPDPLFKRGGGRVFADYLSRT